MRDTGNLESFILDYWEMLGAYEQGFFLAAARAILDCGPEGETYDDIIEMIQEAAGNL